MLAFVLDMMVVNLIIIGPFKPLLQKLLPAMTFQESLGLLNSSPESVSAVVTITIIISVLMMLYFVILEKKLGQTLGKMLFNVRLRSDKKDLGYWRVFVSNLTLLPFFPFIILWVVDPIYLLFKGQRLMEKIVGLKLVEEVREW